MHRQVQEMLAAGFIEPSASPWVGPAVMVPKAGNKYRLVIGMRKVNDALCVIGEKFVKKPNILRLKKDIDMR